MRPQCTQLCPPRLRPALLLIAAAAALGGCVYRMNIQQGNFLEPRAVSQLQVGMTRSQVRYLLGTPMVPDAFDNDRWDYLYYLKKGRLKAPEQHRLTVYFDDEKVARVDNQGTPLLTEPVAPSPESKSPAPARTQPEAPRVEPKSPS